MKEVYLFNPEHDLALAHGSHSYTAPPFARQFRRDMRLLPAWLAPSGAYVAVPDDCDTSADARWLERMNLSVTPIAFGQIAALGSCRIHPWGWDAALRYRLVQSGVDERYLPPMGEMEWVRRLSHRRVTIEIHKALGVKLSPFPLELCDCEDVADFMTEHPGCYLKMPWSGSGKGIYRVIDPVGDRHVPRWIEGALRRQGSLLCEVGLDRVQDFAIECECCGGKTVLIGYSVFSSDFHSQFGAGMVAPREELHQFLTNQYSDLDQVVNLLLAALDKVVAPHYNGPLGVDMMLYRDEDGALSINPCVEINLRMTMGMVTAALGERHGMCGKFVIGGPDSAGEPLTPVADYTAFLV